MILDPQGIELVTICRHVDFTEKDVLEVGCGDGRVSAMIAPLVRTFIGIDPELKKLEKAKGNYTDIDFKQGTGESLGFTDSSFDIVLFTFSLHHQDSSLALAEARRVLRPGGSVLIIEPVIEGDMHSLFNIFNQEDEDIIAAQKAVGRCAMEIETEEAFNIEYLFDGPDDIYDYFFDIYEMARNTDYMARINKVLGAKIDDIPLHLHEAVKLWVLEKPQ